jgi:hypothetical protein
LSATQTQSFAVSDLTEGRDSRGATNPVDDHLRRLQLGYRQTVGESSGSLDPSSYAFRGYQAASSRPGAGHLAWERIGARFATLRQRAAAERRGFTPNEVSYTLGFCLGLRDHGDVSVTESEALIEAVLPVAVAAPPAYATMRFWFLVSLLAVACSTSVWALEMERPEYAEISRPAFHPTTARAAVPVEAVPAGELDARAERSLVDGAVVGSLSVADASERLKGLPYAQTARITGQLMKRLDVTGRLLLVDGLSTLATGAGTPLLLRAIHDPTSEVVAAALAVLAGRGEQALLAELPALLRNSDTGIRKIAVEAFGVMGEPTGAWRLVGLLEHSDAGLRVTTRRALTQLVGTDHGPDPKSWLKHLPSAGNG